MKGDTHLQNLWIAAILIQFMASLAYPSVLNPVGSERVGAVSSATRACPPPASFPVSGSREEVSVAQLKEKYTRSMSASAPDFCGAFFAAHELLSRDTDGEAIQWAERMLSALFEQKDYRSTVIQGLRALTSFESLNDPKSREEIRWLILEAVNGSILALGPEMDPTWLEYALQLKIPPDRNGRLLSYRGFLDDYPDSIYAKRITELQSNAASLFIERELRIARFYTDRTHYVAAIARLESLIEFEFSDPMHPLILEEIIRNLLLAADLIENPPRLTLFYRWKDDDIRSVFRMKADQPVERSKIARELRAQAAMRTQQLSELRANDP